MEKLLDVSEAGEVVAGETVGKQCEEHEEADEQQGALHGRRAVGELGVARHRRSGQGGAESSGELRLLPVRYVRSLGPPLLIWAATTAVVVSCAAAFGYDPSRSATWARWDSIQYLGIAHDGYDLSHCTTSYTPADWCGDAGWFPAYPWLVRALHFVGLPLGGTAVAVSWFFGAATLVLLWNTFFKRRTDVTALGALVYAAWAPGQIYDYAVFPLSMLAFFTVASLWFLHRGRYVAAGLSGAVAALTYPLGVLLIPVSALWLLAQRGSPWRARLRRTAYASGIAALGVVALLIDQRIETGHWNAYFLVQDKYHHSLQNPIAATRDSLRPLVHGSPFALLTAPAFQTAVVTAALLAVLVHTLLHRRTADRLDGLLIMWALATWALPLSQAAVSIQRSQAALLPLAILLRRLPRPLLFALIAAAVPVAVAMEKLFLQGKIT